MVWFYEKCLKKEPILLLKTARNASFRSKTNFDQSMYQFWLFTLLSYYRQQLAYRSKASKWYVLGRVMLKSKNQKKQ